jgi:soluble lytic murein transglycosylase
VLTGLLDHVTDRARWEELRAALAMCYSKQGKLPELRKLLTEANLGGFSDAATAALLFELAQAEEDQQQWNDALAHYVSCGKLGGARGAAAWLGAYRILKHVQDPLDVDTAIDYLGRAAQAPPENPVLGKAVEELLPLLIFRGQSDRARQLAEHVLALKFKGGAEWEQEAQLEQLQEVAHTWLGYIDERAGDKAGAAQQRGAIPCRFWNYYELVNNNPPHPDPKATPEVLATEESAGEYLAGLGLDSAAAEFYAAEGHPDNQLLLYFQLRDELVDRPLATTQWDATKLLEDGRLREAPLLDYVLEQAYPQPFAEAVEPAATQFKVPAALMYAIMKKESAFKPDNVSWAGAVGLMQVMPDTASFVNNSYGLGLDLTQLKQPRTNARLGAANLRMLFDQLGASNVRGVITAHNKGPGNYQKWQGLYPSDPMLFTELIPNEENESFSKLVWKYYELYKWREQPQ